MSAESPADRRHLPIEGTHNFRDVGGYPTADGGATRWRTLFRSDSLHALTAAGTQSLVDLRVRSSIDLRSDREVGAEPSALSLDARFAYLRRPLAAGLLTAPEGMGTLGEFYVYRIENAKGSFLSILETLAGWDVFPAIVNCTVGKDRTGLVIAFLLGLVGVPRSSVMEDYVLTERYASELIAQVVERHRADGRAWMLECPPEAMEQALDHLDRRYGGAAGYAREIGLSDEAVGAVRSALVGPAP